MERSITIVDPLASDPLAAKKHEDIETLLSQVSRRMECGTRLVLRLANAAAASRAELIAAIVAGEAYHSWGSFALEQSVLYCLLTEDWGNLAELADESPRLKEGLQQILTLSEEEWAKLRELEPLSDDLMDESDKYIERLLAVS